MMKLAFLFGPTCVGGRPFDFTAIDTSPRGLTGTDNSFLGYAKAMSDRGHDVTLYVDRATETTYAGMRVRNWLYRREINELTDAVCCWVDVQGLEWVPESCVRLLNMQLNNWDVATGAWMQHVDVFAAPSQWLLDRLRGMGPKTDAQWLVLPNGCDPSVYTPGVKVPGRCIYASSPDRGLHVLLEQWPRIRAAVPHAHLKVFYHNLERWIDDIPNMEKRAREFAKLKNERVAYDQGEQARRASIIRDMIGQPGVERVGSVSRQQMAREYSEAEVLAYPCDTVGPCEGFGVAVLEGCASGAVPIITSRDAFGEIYTGACPVVSWSDSFADSWGALVIQHLTDSASRNEWVAKGAEFAARHAWPVLAERLESVIAGARKRKKILDTAESILRDFGAQ